MAQSLNTVFSGGDDMKINEVLNKLTIKESPDMTLYGATKLAA